jgi:hypothetical protein
MPQPANPSIATGPRRVRAQGGRLGGEWRLPLAVGIGLLAMGVLTIIVSQAQATGVARHPGRHEVTLGFDKVEPGRLVGAGVPVVRGIHPAASDARTIYSVRLPQVRPSEELLVRGSVAMSRCDESDQRPGGGAHVGALHSPCESVRHPYSVPGGGTYDPRIGIRAFLGHGRSDLRHRLGNWQVRRCSVAVHHCPLQVRISLSHLRRRSGSSWLNLAATAFSPRARLGARGRAVDVVQLDGECRRHDFNPCKPVLASASSNTRGELQAIRFGSSRHPARPRTTRRLVNRRIRVQASRRTSRETRPRIILREPVRHLSPGDIVDARARFHLRDHAGDGYVFRHEVSGLLFLSPDPGGVRPGPRGRWLAPSSRTNCPHRSGCEIEKVGATTVPERAPKTMWVAYVGSARDSGGRNGAPTDVTGGSVSVAVDRPGVR